MGMSNRYKFITTYLTANEATVPANSPKENDMKTK